MLTSQLILVLQRRLERHGDLPVVITYEGTYVVELEPENVYKGVFRNPFFCGMADRSQLPTMLLMDADGNAYKKRYADDLQEGEGETVL